MRLLINSDLSEHKYLPSLEFVLDGRNHEGLVTEHMYTIGSLVKLAKAQNCQAILCANTDTLRNLTGKPEATLDEWRGTRFNFEVPVIVINSLAHFFSVPHGEWLLGKDLDKLKTAYVKAAPFSYTVLKTVDQFSHWLKLASKAIIIGCDIETSQYSMKKKATSTKKVPCFGENYEIAGLGETWITCLSFSLVMEDLSIETCVLPLVNGSDDFWHSDRDYAMAINFMRTMMDAEAPKCFHNGLYDCFHLIRYGAFPRNWTMDTIGLSHSWYSELPKTLDFLASWTLYDYYYWKDEADAQHKARDYESYWQYNAKDSWAMCRALLVLLNTGDRWMFTNYASNFPMVYPSLYCAFEGLKINNETRIRLKKEAEISAKANLQLLRIMTDDPEFNPGSSAQVSHFLYEILGAKRPSRAKTATASGSKDRLNLASQHPIIAMFCDRIDKYNKDMKAISTYYSFLQWHGRLMYSLDPFGTDTSRMASRASAGWVGTQIQNQPSYAKEMYEPDEGYIGCEMDFSKAEAICTAYLSGCAKLIEALKDKSVDFYKRLGTLFFQMPVETVTDDFRNKVLKKIQHGTNYMMREDTFIDNCSASILNFAAGFLGFTITEAPTKGKEYTLKQFAKKLLDSYHIPFPEVSEWWKKVRIEVATTGRLISPTGHVRYFFGDPFKNHAVFRSAVAHQPQNLSVTKLNQGLWKVYKYMQKEPGVIRLKTQIHDSIKFQIKINRAREIIPELQELVIARQEVNGRMMQIDVDVEVYNTNWKGKTKWPRFLETTLPMLESQNPLTSTIDGSV